ncbi:hypothetical protein E2562_015565 [Oryza meyeriana var. granulata]|uniref:FH2 domain-containing protein n=1 Tax=Oryza meyeriana var. granulata TaxID=110450 RepID=A0A6G1CGP2_9ORYZ|nr:hypothetical protein E2562_015565 [Oryza meyeriana var. granulata]
MDGIWYNSETEKWRLSSSLLSSSLALSLTLESSSSSSCSVWLDFVFFFLLLAPSMPPAIARFVAIAAVLLCGNVVVAAESGGVGGGGGGARRVLHQPLFPIEWTPPPSPPPPPAPDFTSDPSTPPAPDAPSGDFFPPAPPTTTPTSPGTTSSPTTVAADVSKTPSGSGSGHHGGGPTKATIVAAGAAAAAAVALLGFACAFLITGRARRRGDSQKLLSPDRGAAAHHSGPSAADFLYVGTVEPTTPARHHGPTNADLAGSPYRKLRSERARRGVSRDEETDHPSPELRPLPPLRRAATLGSSDEDAYYTPRQRSGGSGGGAAAEAWSEASASSPPTTTTASRRSLPSMTSDFFPPVTPIAAPPPPPARSRRTPPRTRFSTGSAPDVKQVVSPSPRPVQPSNAVAPPPPPPPPPPPKLNTAPKPPPPPPPPVPSNNNLPKPPEPPAVPTSRRRLLKPLPPEGPRIAMPMPITAATTVDNNRSTSMREGDDGGSGEPRPKLKPLHWDKVRATSDRAMVWDQLKLDEDMIEALFMNNSTPAAPPREVGRKVGGVPSFRQEERVLDPKKAQNIAILLRALNVTREEVSDALLDGNAECLGTELLETLVKMAPTKEEELKLRDYNGDLSKLGSAERFLKAVLDIPFAFKRVDAMLYRANFETEINYLRKSFETLELVKILEAVGCS